MSNVEQVAGEFLNYYYNIFDTNRAGLAGLYREQSCLTFEGQAHQGAQNIAEKLVGLPFQNIKHIITTQDVQPSIPGSNCIIVFVTGQLAIDGEERPMNFSQVFHLVPEGNTYWVFNDIFRLNLA
ncbi:nuclear transport factor 2 [Conidiobolus coronatus NRRL 28638]|uniref:Nuclear transport factor 2 n=1 Tax=Conidiobolus coronatus (strain ATCC 28846 / CBS 209.66 / NRRL 28638) TaxID=796925 RepID=A0A137PEV8_CONC2|nr:nuclear transport factor 2 [Conidiobolus coronatus NRRL 28638]|eukprot:KXN73502.1 nuclear transport factor 2 [Conidiobolus coronatus NRRL 28638]